MNYRLWIGDEDMGTAGERPARMWLAYQRKHHPDENAHIEEVPDDAPVFLKDHRVLGHRTSIGPFHPRFKG